MFSSVNTVLLQGINLLDIEVQVHVAKGIPAFNIVGLPDKSIAESRERIRAALSSINLPLPSKRITVNLSPADLFKEGSHYDLPITVGLLKIMEAIPSSINLSSYIISGELALNGNIISVSGILPTAIHAQKNKKILICPYENGKEAALIEDINILAVKDLVSIIKYFNNQLEIPQPKKFFYDNSYEILDMKDVKGQFIAKRSLEISAAGGHNIIMVGPPGTGKSMLAKRLLGILPDLTNEEVMEVNIIKSVVKNINNTITRIRPFREPHTSCTIAAMVGGGKNITPGEITLAHKGVLFLDELPEFSKGVLESLRQPLENRNVTISRANGNISYPADFQLVAAMNPCRCGYFGDVSRACNKSPKCALDYQNKLSGPIMDRIDLYVEVSAVNILSSEYYIDSEKTKDIKLRVINAREIQKNRYEGSNISCNAHMYGDTIAKFLLPDKEGLILLEKILAKKILSNRGYIKTLKIARTIADLAGSEQIKKLHIVEALGYRSFVNQNISSLI